ncbi:hypothetical protein ACWUX8_27960 [Klebsiella pneumoniae]
MARTAATEAERAGAAGRVFSAVATEIKSLSGETNKASGRIIEILSAIRESVVDTSADVRSAGLVLDQVASAASIVAFSASRLVLAEMARIWSMNPSI